jgi:hypothetical protein
LFRHDLRTSRPAKWRIALIRSTTSSANALDRNRAIGHGLASEPGGGNMRCAIAVVILSLLAAPGWAAPVNGTTDSLGAVSQWISNYRGKPQPARLPAAVRALSQAGAFKDPESSGVYVGFMAGVIGANPARAKELIAKSLAIHPADHWALVRAIAYSGLPEWKSLLEEFAGRMPTRKVMIEKYLAGELPTLAEIPLERRSHSLWEKMSGYFTSTQPDVVTVTFDGSPELLDTLWGYYFATGSYTPIGRMVTLLPWSTERDSVEKLTIGGMAKYTLVSNAARDAELLAMLKWASEHQSEKVQPVLRQVIDAAETMETTRVRKDALAAIEELKRKGPHSRREMSTWGQIGQGALALGCIAAAATGQVQFGLPCVLGGAASSAALNYWSGQQ